MGTGGLVSGEPEASPQVISSLLLRATLLRDQHRSEELVFYYTFLRKGFEEFWNAKVWDYGKDFEGNLETLEPGNSRTLEL